MRQLIVAMVTYGAVLLLLALGGRDARAQQVLTLQEAIRQAEQNSPAARVAHLRHEAARWNYRTFTARYLPGLSLNGNAPGLERAISDVQQDDGSVRYLPQSRTYSAMQVSLSQVLPMTGGQLFVSSGLNRIDLFGEFESNQWQASPLLIGFSQPLFQFNQMKWERRTEPLRYAVAERTYTADLAEVALDITDRFFDVYIAQMNVANASFNVAINDTIYTLSRGRFEIGRIAENDLLQSELALINAQTTLSDARIAYDRALQNLKLALDLPYDAAVEIAPPEEILALEVAPQAAVDQALRNRADVLAMDLQALEAEREVARARRSSSFSANLSASYGLNQTAPVLNDVYTNLLNQQRVNISFQVPLFHWGQGRAEREAALASLRQTEQEITLQHKTLQQEVYFEALQFDQLQQQVRIAAKADTIATRRFEVAKNRYTIGKIDITDLFNAQREKDNARQSYVQTLRQYWISYYRLRRLTLFDFARRQPLPMPVE